MWGGWQGDREGVGVSLFGQHECVWGGALSKVWGIDRAGQVGGHGLVGGGKVCVDGIRALGACNRLGPCNLLGYWWCLCTSASSPPSLPPSFPLPPPSVPLLLLTALPPPPPPPGYLPHLPVCPHTHTCRLSRCGTVPLSGCWVTPSTSEHSTCGAWAASWGSCCWVSEGTGRGGGV